MQNKMLMFLAVFALVIGGFGFQHTALAQDTLSIHDIQYVPDPLIDDTSPYIGDTVVVRGLVMNYPTDLWVGARWAVYIVDPDSFPNPWSGFFIIQHDTFETQTLLQFVEPGMICNFTGVIDEFNQFSQMNIYGNGYFPNPVIPVEILSVGNPLPQPVTLTTADLEDRGVAEQWESMWAQIDNATVVNNNVPGNWASITDASGGTSFIAEYFNWFRDRLNNGTYQWPTNGTNLNVTGFTRDESGTPGQVFTINPRDTLDLQILTNPPQISDVVRNPGVPTSSDNVQVSATIVDNGTVSQAILHYSVNWGNFQQVTMSASADTFAATIPAQADGDFVRYFVSAIDNDGESSTLPGDTSLANGQVFFYVVRDGGLTIKDVQYTWGYHNDVSGYLGYEVTLQGVVMTDSTDEFNDFWLQDADSQWSGIWVNNTPVPQVKGDEVSVTGFVEESFSVTRLNNVSQVSVVTPGVGEFPPVDVTTGEVTTGGVNAEAYESVLVRLQNVTVTDPFPDGFPGFGEFVVDDGSGGVRIDDAFDAFDGQTSDTTYHQGDHIAYITGFGYFSFGNAKVIPRDSLDVGPITGIVDNHPLLPDEFVLEQNFPNPFNPSTDIRYSIIKPGQYSVVIYNLLGQKVRTLVNGHHTVGTHQLRWNGRDDSGNRVSSGIYFYRLSGKNVSITKKMILLK